MTVLTPGTDVAEEDKAEQHRRAETQKRLSFYEKQDWGKLQQLLVQLDLRVEAMDLRLKTFMAEDHLASSSRHGHESPLPRPEKLPRRRPLARQPAEQARHHAWVAASFSFGCALLCVFVLRPRDTIERAALAGRY